MRMSSFLTKPKVLKATAHFGALLPLAWMVQNYFANNLTVNPIQELTFRTGRYALTLLILSLAITPLNSLFGWRKLIPLRRLFGLYAFFYAALHFLIFVGLDYGFDWELLQDAIFEKRYALVGFSAFLILLALTLTSNKSAMKRLGKRWKKLHRLAYLAGGLVIVHFVWLVKADLTRPLLYGAVMAFFLAFRLRPLRHRATAIREKLRRRPRALRPGESQP